MHKMKRIPLEERLKSAKRQVWKFPGVFMIFTEDYYTGLSGISKDPYFMNIYENEIFVHEAGSTQLAQFLYFTDEIPEEWEERILYHILIEPFVRIKNFERSCNR